MTFVTQNDVSFGDTWSATQHNILLNNFKHLNTAFHVPLFPLSSGRAAVSGLTAAAYSIVQSSGAGTIKPEYPILSCDAAATEGRIWDGMIGRGYGSTLTVAGSFYMASATSGNVVLTAQIACISDTDASVTAKVFAATNSSTVAVPGAAGTEKVFSITMTNADSVVAVDRFMLAFYREGGNGSDTATGDLQLTRLSLFYALE